MTYNEMYNSVKAWTDAEYKHISTKRKRIDPTSIEYSGLVIWAIGIGSPADLLGLKKHDVLLTVNGKAPYTIDLDKVRSQPKSIGTYKFQFYRPKTEELITIKSKNWPFGIQLRPSPVEYTRDLRIDDPELDIIESFWRDGDIKSLASFYEPLEILNHRLLHLDGNPYFKTKYDTPHENAPLTAELWHSNFAYLALCAACANQFKRARYVLDEIKQRMMESESGFPCIPASMMHYTESLLASAKGEKDRAIDYMHAAIDSAWEIEENYHRLGRITGNTISIPKSNYETTNIKYDLPVNDPTDTVKQFEAQLNLQQICETLQPGQCILVVLLSEYRSNYFYYNGWRASAPILKKLKSIFPLIHIVTAGTYYLDETFLGAERYLSEAGIDFKILYDQSNSVAEQLDLQRAPTNFALNHKGKIIAEGHFWDETLIWKTLAKSNA